MGFYAPDLMNRIYFTILFLAMGTLGFSQSLQVVETKNFYNVKIGDEIRTIIKLKNLSDQPVHVLVRRDEAQIGSSQRTFFCWDNDCKDESVGQTYISQRIEPGQILETFFSVLEAGLNETSSLIKYVFYNRDDPSDLVEVTLNYAVKERVSDGLLYNSSKIRLSDIYPNPVSDIAYIDYSITNEDTEAEVVLHNLLGSLVAKFNLNPNKRVLKIYTTEFKPGVYFYTLYVDSEGKVTKKIIVKR